MYQAVIFDLDGTLLNTLTDLANSCNYALAQQGLPTHSVESYKLFVGNGRDKLIERALGTYYTPQRFDRTRSINDAHYLQHKEDSTAPYAGIVPLLETLAKKGIRCAVASNKPNQFAAEMVQKYFTGLIPQDYAFGLVDGGSPKPSPNLIHKIIEKLNLEKSQVLYVGDSGVDMQTAVNAGVDSCGVLWGFRDREELTQNGAKYLAQTAEELQNIILE
ncbi:MAG: HAD family hydrolase [Oscillospiraceae bacterium]|nr:HAD family hydrolase [Oscillospiraceae bacterium]